MGPARPRLQVASGFGRVPVCMCLAAPAPTAAGRRCDQAHTARPVPHTVVPPKPPFAVCRLWLCAGCVPCAPTGYAQMVRVFGPEQEMTLTGGSTLADALHETGKLAAVSTHQTPWMLAESLHNLCPMRAGYECVCPPTHAPGGPRK